LYRSVAVPLTSTVIGSASRNTHKVHIRAAYQATICCAVLVTVSGSGVKLRTTRASMKSAAGNMSASARVVMVHVRIVLYNAKQI